MDTFTVLHNTEVKSPETPLCLRKWSFFLDPYWKLQFTMYVFMFLFKTGKYTDASEYEGKKIECKQPWRQQEESHCLPGDLTFTCYEECSAFQQLQQNNLDRGWRGNVICLNQSTRHSFGLMDLNTVVLLQCNMSVFYMFASVHVKIQPSPCTPVQE